MGFEFWPRIGSVLVSIDEHGNCAGPGLSVPGTIALLGFDLTTLTVVRRRKIVWRC
ncbi:MAG: hypothetical protein JJ992_16335 [Planctomycetes bacterium]|nr:hypothetical protein [Planctomycetota bacterium]